MVWGPGATLHPVGMRTALEFVLMHPELDTFSVSLANTDDVLAEVAAALGCPVDVLRGYATELVTDTEVAAMLPRHMVRSRPDRQAGCVNLLGRHVPKYVATRVLKPRLVVETGVKDGYGSLSLLRALQRNRAESFPGELVSFDLNPVAGRAVPEQWRAGWRFVPRPSSAMTEVLRGREVNLLVSDSSPDYACVAAEVRATLDGGAPQIVIFGNADWNAAIRDAQDDAYTKHLAACTLVPDDPLYPPHRVDLAVFRRIEQPS
jgi:hypothetical protein